MVKGGPAVGVDIVDVGVAVFDDRFEGVWFGVLEREHSLVDWCFAKDGLAVVNLASTIHKVLNVAIVCLSRRFV